MITRIPQKDPYVQKALEENLPSRSSFKLKEINEDNYLALLRKLEKKRKGRVSNKQKRLIQPDMLVVDLGACPGGWSLYTSTILKPNLGGSLIAVDLLPLDETLQSQHSDVYARIKDNLQSSFQFIQGDFTDNHTRWQIKDACSNNISKPDLILSDMAANFSGDSSTDALRTINLCEQALHLAVELIALMNLILLQTIIEVEYSKEVVPSYASILNVEKRMKLIYSTRPRDHFDLSIL